MPEIIQFDAFEYEVEMIKIISLIQYGTIVLRYQKRLSEDETKDKTMDNDEKTKQ